MLSAKRLRVKMLLGFALAGFIAIAPAMAADLVTGVIVLNPAGASLAEQNEIISQLKAAGVHVIRTGMTTDDPRIDFAKRAFAAGIRIDALIQPQCPKGVALESGGADEVPKVWGGIPLAAADPDLSKAYFQTFIQKIEANGIVLAGLELGNEINWTNVNKDFPKTIHGQIFDYDDLTRDPRGKQAAAGLLQYLKALAALKDVRDHSKLNRETPIISAGLSTVGPAGTAPNFFTQHGFAVTISATLRFLRANGLDNLVDAYGIHYYPGEKTPEARRTRADNFAVSECKAPGSAAGKPCWITEWGVSNNDKSCPPDESQRAPLMRETMEYFRGLARQGRLTDVLYYSWNSPPGSDQINPSSIVRCGKLTEAGKLAVTP